MLASQGVSFHVVLVTSAPPSEHQQFLTEFGADRRFTYWYEPGGPAHKRNYGVLHGGGVQSPYIAFVDDDAELSPDCLYEFVQWMEEHPQCGMAFGRIYNAERRRELDDAGSFLTFTGFLWARANNQLDTGQYTTPCRVLASKSATCMVRLSAFKQVGGFDEDYYILAEDSLLAYTLWLVGWECWYVPSATSWHWFNTSMKPKEQYYTTYRIFFLGARNYTWMLLSCLGLLRLLLILPIHVSIWHLAALGFFLKQDYQRGWFILKGVWSGLLLGKAYHKRQRIQATRLRTDRELFQHTFAFPPFSYYTSRISRYLSQAIHG